MQISQLNSPKSGSMNNTLMDSKNEIQNDK